MLVNKEVPGSLLGSLRSQEHCPGHLELCRGDAEGKITVIQPWVSASFLSVLDGIV